MLRSAKSPLVPAVVALLLALSLASGCNDNGTSGGAISTAIVATYTPDAEPTEGSVTLQEGDETASSDTFNVEIVVMGVDDVSAVTFQVTFNPYLLAFVGSDFSGCFLVEGLADPGSEFEAGALDMGGGEVDVFATRIGEDLGGVPMEPTDQGVLGVLTFQAIREASVLPELAIEDIVVKVCVEGGICENRDVTVAGGTVSVD